VQGGEYSPDFSALILSPSGWNESPPSIPFQHLCLQDGPHRVHFNLILSIPSKRLSDAVKDSVTAFDKIILTTVSFYRRFREDSAVIVKVVGAKDEVDRLVRELRQLLRLLEGKFELAPFAIRELSQKDYPFSFS
jgi:hypothetical protein